MIVGLANNLATLANEGISVTLIGMGIVFLILAILWGVLECMRLIFYKPVQTAKAILEPTPAPAPVVEAAPEPEPQDDTEVIAAITAAIAVYMDTDQSNIKIKSVKKISESGNAWKMAARRQTLDSRL